MLGVGAGPADAGATAAAQPRVSGVPDAEERAAWIALAAVPGVGQAGFARLLQRYGSARAVLERSPVEVVTHVPRADGSTRLALERLQQVGARRSADELEHAAARAGAAAITSRDGAYPARLAALPIQPPVLYVAGDPAGLSEPCVAVVGTRHPTGYGRAAAAEIADELARAGVCVISGLALGIDGIAHRAAIAAGGRTAAVLPSPVDRVYPPRHRELASAMVAAGGAVVAETPPGRMTGKPDFARRNRIVSGLADAVVVVEAPDHSGALLTASSAVDQGRDLFAVPGPIDSAASRGCNRLIADHQAEIVTSPVALVQRIGLRPAGRLPLAVGLSESEGLVLGSLLQCSGSIEELMARTQLATSALASALTLLEARGLVTSYGGATFHPTLAARQNEIGR